jgi:spore coat polysaccharide biosynthesis predicted glycosyltransferase SpsG
MNIAFRVDLGFKRGLGHLTRSLALAEQFKKPENRIFFYIPFNKYASGLIKENGCCTVPSKDPDTKLLSDLTDQPETLVITDVLYPKQRYLAKLKKRSFMLVSLDDLAEVYFASDIVIHGSIDRKRYGGEKGSKFLAGNKYVMINREFRGKKRESKEFNSKKLTILISVGGSDPNNLTMGLMKILSEIKDRFYFYLVIGPYADRVKELKRYAREAIEPRKVFVGARHLSEILLKSDIAIVSGGRMAYECAFVGIPMIAVCQAPHQVPTVRAFARRGCLVAAGCFPCIRSDMLKAKLVELDENRNLLKTMSARGRKIVDGKGAERVADFIRDVYGKKLGDLKQELP